MVEPESSSFQVADKETLGASLRRSRLAHNITLEDVAARTKIKRQLFDELERDDLTNWPTSRFYTESYLRAYASAIGLDPREVVEQFRSESSGEALMPPTSESKPASRSLWLALPAVVLATFVVGFAIGEFQTRGTASEPENVEEAPALPPTVNVTSSETPVIDLSPAFAPEPEPIPTTVPENVEGELMISSTPEGHVTVNGIARGMTPVLVRFLPAGSYTVRIVEPGYQIIERRVSITPERPRASISLTLERP